VADLVVADLVVARVCAPVDDLLGLVYAVDRLRICVKRSCIVIIGTPTFSA
jgi:hypothetical protein